VANSEHAALEGPSSGRGIVNLSGRGMLVVSWRGGSGRGTPLLAYHAAPLKPSGAGKRRPGSAKLTMPSIGMPRPATARMTGAPVDRPNSDEPTKPLPI
jgi:hypothetical protein